MAASRTYVVCPKGSLRIAGYFALSMGQILAHEAAGSMRRNMPKTDSSRITWAPGDRPRMARQGVRARAPRRCRAAIAARFKRSLGAARDRPCDFTRRGSFLSAPRVYAPAGRDPDVCARSRQIQKLAKQV